MSSVYVILLVKRIKSLWGGHIAQFLTVEQQILVGLFLFKSHDHVEGMWTLFGSSITSELEKN